MYAPEGRTRYESLPSSRTISPALPCNLSSSTSLSFSRVVSSLDSFSSSSSLVSSAPSPARPRAPSTARLWSPPSDNFSPSTVSSLNSSSSLLSDVVSIPDNLFASSYLDPAPASAVKAFISFLDETSPQGSALPDVEEIRKILPSSPSAALTPLQVASVWLSDQYSKDPSLPSRIGDPGNDSAFLYKKVANKVRPVATTLPENFRIVRREHPDPLNGLPVLPTHPPEFTPKGRVTQERRDKMVIGKDLLWPEEVKLVEWLLCAHDTAFAWNDDERGAFDPEYFDPIEIPHIEHVPWVLRQGPIPRGLLPEITKIIENKWRSGVYEPSSSSYNSRWFCVFKKDGKSLRLVHSLEPLNAVTIKNAALPPYTDLVAENFAGRSIYTTLDLYVSFDQRQLHPASRDMTTFNTPLGAFRLTVLPMGWTNSPAVLQGDITHILREEIPKVTEPFADDVAIRGPETRYELPDGSYETIPDNPGIRRFVWEHLNDVNRVIQRCKAHGVTFSGTKAIMGVPQTEILGHVCSYEGRVADKARVQAIRDWPVPTTVSEVRAFLGTCGVLRMFIKNYTIIARPLIHLTRKDVPFEFGPDQIRCFETLKDVVANCPAIRPVDYNSEEPVILAVDSCANGVGFILLQVGRDKKRHPCRFGSITFSERESRYSQAKLELYGLFRALKQTRVYTIGAKNLVVEMDAKFIKGMLSSPSLHPNDAVSRWVSAILIFNFTLVHVPADKHTGADGLSRRPRAPEDPSWEDLDELDDWVDANSGFFLEANTPSSPFDRAPSLSLFSSEREEPSEDQDSDEGPTPLREEPEEEIPRSRRAEQLEEKLARIRLFLETKERPPDLTDGEYRLFIRQAMDYFIWEGNLCRKGRDGGYQVIPDRSKRFALIRYAHDRLGHKGIYATTRNLLVRFWWPYLSDDVRWYTRTCHECQVRQTKYFHIPPVPPEVPSLFRKAHIDTFYMKRVGNYRYVLHARCAMSSVPEARATTAETGEVVGKFIFEDLLCRWGALSDLITDNGPAYVAGLDWLSRTYGINHIRISGYNSQANGIVERKHFDVREAIVKTCDGVEQKWRSVLPQVLWAERITIRRSTGYSPYYMAHGVHPVLPFDITQATYLCPRQNFGMTTEELVATRAKQLLMRTEDLDEMRKTVAESRKKGLERFEEVHRSRIHDFNFQPKDLVLIRNSRVEKSLDSKSKPRYIGPMVVVRRTKGHSYVVAELDGSLSRMHVAAFRLIPYLTRTKTDIPIVMDNAAELDLMDDDPEDVRYLEGLPKEKRVYRVANRPFPST